MRILVTGVDGFVGGNVSPILLSRGHQLTGAVMAMPLVPNPRIHYQVVGAIGRDTGWRAAVNSCDAVIHLAARVHQMADDASAEELYRQTNVDGTVGLARAAMAAGVSRFVFLSTVKVIGEATRPGEAWTECTPLRPEDAYGRSKRDAESELQALAAHGLPVVILRPPLIYGPGVKGNLLPLMQVVARGLPLPFRGIDNQRSLLSVFNLASAFEAVLTDQRAIGRTYLVADGAPVSTEELVRCMATAAGVAPRLFRLPAGVWRGLNRIPRLGERLHRLIGSLVVDDRQIRQELGWVPTATMIDGFRETYRRNVAS